LVSRMGRSVLNSFGISELITTDNDQYIQTCVLLSKDLEFSEMIQGKLMRNKANVNNGVQISLNRILKK